MKRLILILFAIMSTLNTIAQDDGYTFSLPQGVVKERVSFRNRFGIILAGDLYKPSDCAATEKRPALAVCGPFGAVKEQSSGLYAAEMARRGFVCVAFDPSFTGESGGDVRGVASPDINTEDFSAAVDFLSTLDCADAEHIGIVGICGWGGFALNAAAIDTRIRATVTSTMYDMTRVTANGYFDSVDEQGRFEMKKQLNAQRTQDFIAKEPALADGLPETLTGDEPQFVKDYWGYYKTPRGWHERSINSNGHWTQTSALALINQPILQRAGEIRSAVLMVHGERAHSRYFSEDAFQKLRGDNKELLIVPGANHVDLYDRKDVIPFAKIESFFRKNL